MKQTINPNQMLDLELHVKSLKIKIRNKAISFYNNLMNEAIDNIRYLQKVDVSLPMEFYTDFQSNIAEQPTVETIKKSLEKTRWFFDEMIKDFQNNSNHNQIIMGMEDVFKEIKNYFEEIYSYDFVEERKSHLKYSKPASQKQPA